MLDIDLISRVASVLGLQQNYEDLEWLLSQLWLSRKPLTSFSQDVIIQIGRRLVEVRFFHGHVESAIELGEDILYNVQRVYGTSHPSTIDIANLLSRMYVTTGDHAAAKAVIGEGDNRATTPKVNQDSAKSNREYLLQQFIQRNNDAMAAPTVHEPRAAWSFMDRSSEKSVGGTE